MLLEICSKELNFTYMLKWEDFYLSRQNIDAEGVLHQLLQNRKHANILIQKAADLQGQSNI